MDPKKEESDDRTKPQKKRGRGQRVGLNVANIAVALHNSSGNVCEAARLMNVHRQAIYYYVAREPQLKEIIEQARESILDYAEAGLLAACKKQKAWAIKFALATLGRARGYLRNSVPTKQDEQAPPPTIQFVEVISPMPVTTQIIETMSNPTTPSPISLPTTKSLDEVNP